MEADLARYYQIDYRDRWRRDEHGRPRLTLRRLLVLIWRYPPVDGAVVRVTTGARPWTRAEHLLDELRVAVLRAAGAKKAKPHPDRRAAVVRRGDSPDRRRERQAALARARKRRERIQRGEIT